MPRRSKEASPEAKSDPETPFDGEEIAENTPLKAAKPPELPAPTRGKQEPPEFFKYWSALKRIPIANDKTQADRVTVYPYRKWPLTDVTLTLPPDERERVLRAKASGNKRAGPQANLGIETEPFDPDIWEMEILRRYGSGDYIFSLNDNGNKGKQVCWCAVKGIRDDDYPPDVNPAHVVMEDPVNTEFIRKARSRGVQFPGDPAAEFKEADMAEQQASHVLAETVQKVLTGQNEMIGKLQERAMAPPASDGTISVISQMLQSFTQTQTTMMNAILQRLTDQEKAAAAPPVVDPLKTVESITGMAKAIANPGGGEQKESAVVSLLLKQSEQAEARAIEQRRLDMEQRRLEMDARKLEMDALQKRLEASETANRDLMTKLMNPSPTGGLRGFMKEANEMRSFLLGEDGGANTPWWLGTVESLGEKFLDTVQKVVPAFMSKPLPQVPQPQPVVVQQPLPGIPAGQPAKQPTQEEQMMMFLDQFTAEIHPELKASIERGEKGYEFAGRVMARMNELGFLPVFNQIYNSLLLGGRSAVIGDNGMLRRSPQRWGELIRYGQKLETFIDEFLDGPKAQEIFQRIRSAQQAPPPQAAAQNPVPQPSDAPSATAMPQPPPVPDFLKAPGDVKPNGSGTAPDPPRKGPRVVNPETPIA